MFLQYHATSLEMVPVVVWIIRRQNNYVNQYVFKKPNLMDSYDVLLETRYSVRIFKKKNNYTRLLQSHLTVCYILSVTHILTNLSDAFRK